jgi:hypothetical protein
LSLLIFFISYVYKLLSREINILRAHKAWATAYPI